MQSLLEIYSSFYWYIQCCAWYCKHHRVTVKEIACEEKLCKAVTVWYVPWTACPACQNYLCPLRQAWELPTSSRSVNTECKWCLGKARSVNTVQIMSGNGKICQHTVQMMSGNGKTHQHALQMMSGNGKMHQHTLQMVSGNCKIGQHSAPIKMWIHGQSSSQELDSCTIETVAFLLSFWQLQINTPMQRIWCYTTAIDNPIAQQHLIVSWNTDVQKSPPTCGM